MGSQIAAPVLFDIFNSLPNDTYFDKPLDDLVETKICRATGHLASMHCREADTLLIAEAASESSVCPYHQMVHTDDRGLRVHKGCAEGEIKTNSWMVLPPLVEYYYKPLHTGYRVLPSFADNCLSGDEKPLAFIYPDEGAAVYLPHDLDGKQEELIIKATHKDNQQSLYWHLDDQYLGATTELHSMDISPKTGNHILTIVDGNGYEVKRKFSVVGD